MRWRRKAQSHWSTVRNSASQSTPPRAAIYVAHAIYAASPGGAYERFDKGNATLTMTDRGGLWEAVIEAGGIPRGGAMAADCNFTASGHVTGNCFAGKVERTFGAGKSDAVAPSSIIAIAFAPCAATVIGAKVVALCLIGVDVSGRYTRKRAS